jgi:hypothetical protein
MDSDQFIKIKKSLTPSAGVASAFPIPSVIASRDTEPCEYQARRDFSSGTLSRRSPLNVVPMRNRPRDPPPGNIAFLLLLDFIFTIDVCHNEEKNQTAAKSS